MSKKVYSWLFYSWVMLINDRYGYPTPCASQKSSHHKYLWCLPLYAHAPSSILKKVLQPESRHTISCKSELASFSLVKQREKRALVVFRHFLLPYPTVLSGLHFCYSMVLCSHDIASEHRSRSSVLHPVPIKKASLELTSPWLPGRPSCTKRLAEVSLIN